MVGNLHFPMGTILEFGIQCFPECLYSVSQNVYTVFPRMFIQCFPECLYSVSQNVYTVFPRMFIQCFPECLYSVSQNVYTFLAIFRSS